jgi:polysaccharide chain length determinant protein (PEP-CTERM system associated)
MASFRPAPGPHKGVQARSPQRARTGLSPTEILEYLEVPLRRPWHALIPFVLTVVAAVVATFVIPKKYKSTTLILVVSQKLPQTFVSTHPEDETNKRLQTIRQEILSRTRLEQIARELDPYRNVATASMSGIVDRMRDAIEIAVKGNDAFTIEYVQGDPRMAQAVTNRLATLFIDEVAKSREEQVKEAYQFIDAQLQDARRELEKREEALRHYKEQHMGALPEQTTANLATLQRLQLELQSVNESLRLAAEHYPTGAGAGSPVKAESDPEVELRKLEDQLTALRSRYTDEHPDVKSLKARIAEVQASLKTRSSPDGDGLESERARREVAALRQRRDEIEARIATFQARVEAAPQTEEGIQTLSRDFQKLNDNYLALLNKKLEMQMETKIEQRWKGEQFRILDPANLPDHHVSPSLPLYLMGGLVVGLLAGLVSSLGAEFLDPSVKSIGELESLVPFPVLAVIPAISTMKPRGQETEKLPKRRRPQGL